VRVSLSLCWLRLLAVVGWTLLASAGAFGAEANAKRVLIIHSFGRDFAPYDTIASVFRTELARRSPQPIIFLEANLDAGRRASAQEERAFLDYLGTRFAGGPPDVVVTIGPPAARFYLAHRDQLFSATPLVLAALDQRLARGAALRAGDAAVVGNIDLPQLVDNILQLLPETKTIAVVVGASDLERFWRAELQRELARFASHVDFIWLDELSLEQMSTRVAALPPDSAILYGLLIVDAAGVPHERQDGLTSLHAVADAPIFGLYENELGQGVVGGPYSSQRRRGESIAVAVLDALGGTAPAQARIDMAGFEPPVYDWRELKRWNIDEARLPPGSEVRFKPPSTWELYRLPIVATVTVLVLQAGLIAALLWQRTRRRRAELQARDLGGRIITAHEDERRRLARELHDDVTQRLASLAIDAARAESGAAAGAALHPIHEGLVKLSEDVHALSYRLHPSVIEDLGLIAALRAECDRVARNEPLRVDLDSRDVPENLSHDTALCLFRIAQEALRNVGRHAKANVVAVSLLRENGGIVLSVRDDGSGFDNSSNGDEPSLGLASMRERVRLLGGRLEIESARGRGTSVVAWVPLGANA
jgi:signal transduction histidine kinase